MGIIIDEDLKCAKCNHSQRWHKNNKKCKWCHCDNFCLVYQEGWINENNKRNDLFWNKSRYYLYYLDVTDSNACLCFNVISKSDRVDKKKVEWEWIKDHIKII